MSFIYIHLPPSLKMKRVKFLSQDEEKHQTRREEIIKKYPEVLNLVTIEKSTKYYVALTVLCQIVFAYLSTFIDDPAMFVLFSYSVGATAAHSLFLAIHEISHNLAFQKAIHNQHFGMFANLPIGIPYSVLFRRYHLLHHSNFGQKLDTDLPTDFEAYIISYSATCYLDHCVRKFIYLFFYTAIYALRPVIVAPQIVKYDFMLVKNVVVQLGFDLCLCMICGPKALYFLLLSTFLAGSIHPLAGRFLSEHLIMDKNQETYSYYGPWNKMLFSIGLHNEHHDFPNICHTNLIKLHEIAPEYYKGMLCTKSWMETQLLFIFDDSLGPHSRIYRQVPTESPGSK